MHMSDLYSQIVQYMIDDYEDCREGGTSGALTLVITYLEEEYSIQFRTRAKRLYRQLLEAPDEESLSAKTELARFLMEALYKDNRLKSRGNKKGLSIDDPVLKPFIAILKSGEEASDGPQKNSSRKNKAILLETQKRLPENIDLIEDDHLKALIEVLLQNDVRIKSYNVCNRLFELREDNALGSLGARLKDGIDRGEPGWWGSGTSFVTFFNKEKRYTNGFLDERGFKRKEWNTAEWWERVFQDPSSVDVELNVIIECALSIQASLEIKNWTSDLGRVKDLPIRLVDLYLRQNESHGLSSRPSNEEDMIRLVLSMNDKRYRRAVVPLQLDPRTGAGLFVMGKEQAERHGRGVVSFPNTHATFALVDYKMGSPLWGELTGSKNAVGNQLPIVPHDCFIVPPDPGDMKADNLVEEEWRRPLRELMARYDLWAQKEGPETSFASYRNNPSMSLGAMPSDCPEAYRQYFATSSATVKRGIRLEDYTPDAEEPVDAVVPACLVGYLKDRGELEGLSLFGPLDIENAYAEGKIRVSYSDSQKRIATYRRMKAHHNGRELGIVLADFIPYVIKSCYTEEAWKGILVDASEKDDFKVCYTKYLKDLEERGIMDTGKASDAERWLSGLMQGKEKRSVSSMVKHWKNTYDERPFDPVGLS